MIKLLINLLRLARLSLFITAVCILNFTFQWTFCLLLALACVDPLLWAILCIYITMKKFDSFEELMERNIRYIVFYTIMLFNTVFCINPEDSSSTHEVSFGTIQEDTVHLIELFSHLIFQNIGVLVVGLTETLMSGKCLVLFIVLLGVTSLDLLVTCIEMCQCLYRVIASRSGYSAHIRSSLSRTRSFFGREIPE